MAAPRACVPGRGLGAPLALLVVLLLAPVMAEDSDATCKAGEPGCDGAEAAAGAAEAEAQQAGEAGGDDAPSCPPLPEGKAAELEQCVEATKQWNWGLARLQSDDSQGARDFLLKGYQKCLKKLEESRNETCIQAWAEDVVEYRWLKRGLGISKECKAEAHAKYNSGSSEVEECAKKFGEALAEADGPEDQREIYAQVLTECASVSAGCAKQNAYMMAERAQQQALKELGIDTGGMPVRR